MRDIELRAGAGNELSNVRGSTTNASLTVIGPWVDSWLLHQVIVRYRLSAVTCGLIFFCSYWLLPGIFSLLDGTSLAGSTWKDTVHAVTVSRVGDLFNSFVAKQPHGMERVAYLQDRTHFLFASIIACGVCVSVLLVRQFECAARYLVSANVMVRDEASAKAIYDHYRTLAYSRPTKLLAIAISLLTLFAFFAYSNSKSVSYWWGYAGFGNAGLVFSMMIGTTVFWGTRGLFILGYGSLMIGRLLEAPLAFRPFHPDGCNGLMPIGRLILLLWADSAIVALAVFITMQSGYLGIEQTPIAWSITILAIVFLPVLVAFPLFKAHHALLAARMEAMASFEPVLTKLQRDFQDRLRLADYDKAEAEYPLLEGAEKRYAELASANVWPFHRNVTAIVLAGSILQFVVLAREALGLKS